VDYIEIQGDRVPAIGFGTWQLAGDAAREGVRHALELGYRHIDTAQAYGNEAEVGRAIKESGVARDEVFITTKLRREELAGDRVGPVTDESLRRLDSGYIDLLLIHWPSEEVPLKVTLDAMVEQQEAGKVRHIGVSNFRTSLLNEAMAHTRIFTDQVPYQPGRTQRGLCEVARTEDVLLTAYSPLRGRGVADETIEAIAAEHGKTAAQVVLRWLVQQPNVSPIPRSANPDHRAANLDIFDFSLTDDDMARIHALAEPT